MAVTTVNSIELRKLLARPKPEELATHAYTGKLRWLHFAADQGAEDGGDGSIIRLVRVPLGEVRLVLYLARIVHGAFGEGRALGLGWEGYSPPRGANVAADPTGLALPQDVSRGGVFMPASATGSHVFNSTGGVVLTAQVLGGTIPASTKVIGDFPFVSD